MAYLMDVSLQSGAWLVVYFAWTLFVERPVGFLSSLRGTTGALLALGFFSAQWMYWTLCEALMSGQTFGKRWMGIRVVKEDGTRPDFFTCAVRNLLRAVDFLPFGYGVGGAWVLFSGRAQRIGDIVAGTVLALEERVDLARYEASLAHAALAPTTPPLSVEESELVLDFLGRVGSLAPTSRDTLRLELLARFGAHLPSEERARLSLDGAATDAFLRGRAQGSC
jgi:uncharacterized RDD family membrane protein YckC